MAYYDMRTGKKVPPPEGGLDFYVTLLGIGLLIVDNSRSAGIILLSLFWGPRIIAGIIRWIIRKNNINKNK